MRDRRKIQKLGRYIMVIVMVLMCIHAAFHDVGAAAADPGASAGSTISGWIACVDEEGEIVSVVVAAALRANGEYYLYTTDIPSAAYYMYCSYMENYYVIEPIAADDTLGLIQWKIADGSPDASFYDIGASYQGEVCSMLYMDTEKNKRTEVTLTDMEVSGDYAFLKYTGGPDTAYYYPAMLVDEDGKCVGLVTEKGVWAMNADKDAFYKNGRRGAGSIGKYWWVLLVGVGVTGGGVFMKKKSGKEGESAAACESRDISLEEGNPYVQDNKMGIPSASPSVPQPVAYRGMDDVPSTTPYIPPADPAVIPARARSDGKKKIVYKLCAVGGCMDGRVYPVDVMEITFGRDVSASIRFPADTRGVSRIHCKIYWQEDRLMLMDMGSSYGTFISNRGKLRPQSPVELKPGDKFCIGEKLNTFILKNA